MLRKIQLSYADFIEAFLAGNLEGRLSLENKAIHAVLLHVGEKPLSIATQISFIVVIASIPCMIFVRWWIGLPIFIFGLDYSSRRHKASPRVMEMILKDEELYEVAKKSGGLRIAS